MKDKSGPLVVWATNMMAQRLTKLAKTAPSWDTEALLAIIETAKDTYKKVKDEAADIGSIAHKVFEDTLEGKLSFTLDDLSRYAADRNVTQDMLDQARNAIDAGLKFIRENEIEVIHIEQPRWSPTHGYIGTGDLIARINRKLSVLDWKTSKRLYPTVRLQLAAYMMAYEEEHPGEQIEQGVAVNTCKTGDLEVQTYPAELLREDFQVFLGLLDVWRWDRVNQSDPRYNKSVPRRLSQDELNSILAA